MAEPEQAIPASRKTWRCRLRSLNRLQCATALFFCATYGILFAIEGRTLHASLAAIWTGLAALWAWRSYVVDGQVKRREDLEEGRAK